MMIEKTTPYGGIDISMNAIASVAGNAASECYGVVGLASRSDFENTLPKEAFAKGVVAKKSPKGYEVDIYILVAYEVKITEIVNEVQKRVKYILERTFAIKFKAINVYVQGLKEN